MIEFAQKLLILMATAAIGGVVGFGLTFFPKADAPEALAATFFGGPIGIIIGLALGWVIVRRTFD